MTEPARRPPPGIAQRRRIIAVGALLAVLATATNLIRDRFTTDRHGASVQHVTIDSRDVGRKQKIVIVTPKGGGKGRPVLVFLHGRRDGPGGETTNLNEPMYKGLGEQGDRAPVVVFPDGGGGRYWHNRRGGRWGDYVVDEVIPRALQESGADRTRIAIGGISMGGFGALDIARLHPGRFCAVGSHSGALWSSAGETAPGAFDDAEDFGRHNVIGAARNNPFVYGRARVWLDGGRSDPFAPGLRALAAALGRHASVHHYPGGHEGKYWRSHWGAYLSFYARALAACRR